MKTPLQELIERLKEEKHTYMMQEHHPLELSIIEDCFDSAIMKATELLEKEREVIEKAWLNGVSAWDSEMEAEQYYNETYKQNKF